MIYSHYSEYMAQSMSAARPGPDPGEYEYLEKYLKSCEQPFLELACGYGRLLLPIMEHGYAITGTDASPEMLDRCLKFAQERGLKPELHRQFMQKLSLDRQFGLIFMADGTFALIVEDEDIHELFDRVFMHLKPGGTFLFDFAGLLLDPGTGKPTGVSYTKSNWIKAPDGSIFVSRIISRYDPVTHVSSRLQIHDRYVDGKFAGSQAYEDPNRDHDLPVIVSLLESKGFVDIEVGGYMSVTPPAYGGGIYSIRCRKPR